MSHPLPKIRRMFELIEPIGTLTFTDIPNDAFLARGMRNYWDGYFAGRAAPLGLAPAEVVHAVFYNFAEGEVARHIPQVWAKISPAEAIAVREKGSADALRARLGDFADDPVIAETADLATRAACSAPTEGRALYAGLRTIAVPPDPIARLWHASTLLREHRGDGHNAALLAHGIGGTQAHVLLAVGQGMRPEKFGRIHHLPTEQLDAVVDSLVRRGVLDENRRFTTAGRELRDRIEQITDELAAPPYEVLTETELNDLIAGYESVVAAME